MKLRMILDNIRSLRSTKKMYIFEHGAFGLSSNEMLHFFTFIPKKGKVNIRKNDSIKLLSEKESKTFF